MQAHAEDPSKTHRTAPASASDEVPDDDDRTCEAAELEQLADRVSAARSVY